jgi:hypothetical protein
MVGRGLGADVEVVLDRLQRGLEQAAMSRRHRSRQVIAGASAGQLEAGAALLGGALLGRQRGASIALDSQPRAIDIPLSPGSPWGTGRPKPRSI